MSSMPTYSRTDLLNWVNSLLQLQVTKIESCGSGAVYCQILDSVFMDVPMNKVNFEAKTVAQYIQNFKVLQDCFKRHKIGQNIDVSELVKCKMMANLNFLQFMRNFWEANHATLDYDAVSRRAGRGGSAADLRPLGVSAANSGARRHGGPGSRPDSAFDTLQRQNEELQAVVVGLERERDFYFSKLRDIELLFQESENAGEEEKPLSPLLQQIQSILYSTEEGFEVPSQDAVDEFGVQPEMMVEETF